MAYTPDPTLLTQPDDTVKARNAAAEFRALKAYISGLLGLSAGNFPNATINSGLTGANNTGTPNSKYDLSADQVVLKNATAGTVVRTATGTITVDLGLAGPIVNGRDQVAAFGASTWINLFWIWNGTTLGLIASTAAWTSNPVLPTGYTHWAYATTLRFDAGSLLVGMTTKGCTQFYQTSGLPLGPSSPVVETNLSLVAYMPPHALQYLGLAELVGGAGASAAFIKLYTGKTFLSWNATAAANNSFQFSIPNVGQNLIYVLNIATATLTVYACGFTIPNGDS